MRQKPQTRDFLTNLRQTQTMQIPRSLLVFGVLSASLSIVQAAPVRKIVPQGAINFTSKERGFAVWFPGKPTHGTEGTSSGGGVDTSYEGLKWPKIGRRVNPDAVRFVIYATSNSGGTPFSRPAANNHIQEMANLYLLQHKVGWAIKNETIEQAGFPGCELRFLSKINDQSYRMRLFQTAKWVYTISIYGSVAAMKKQGRAVNRVFDSFRILP